MANASVIWDGITRTRSATSSIRSLALIFFSRVENLQIALNNFQDESVSPSFTTVER